MKWIKGRRCEFNNPTHADEQRTIMLPDGRTVYDGMMEVDRLADSPRLLVRRKIKRIEKSTGAPRVWAEFIVLADLDQYMEPTELKRFLSEAKSYCLGAQDDLEWLDRAMPYGIHRGNCPRDRRHLLTLLHRLQRDQKVRGMFCQLRLKQISDRVAGKGSVPVESGEWDRLLRFSDTA